MPGRASSGTSSSRSPGCRCSSATLVIIVVFGRRLLPDRTPASLPQDLGDLTDALRAQYALPGRATSSAPSAA